MTTFYIFSHHSVHQHKNGFLCSRSHSQFTVLHQVVNDDFLHF